MIDIMIEITIDRVFIDHIIRKDFDIGKIFLSYDRRQGMAKFLAKSTESFIENLNKKVNPKFEGQTHLFLSKI